MIYTLSLPSIKGRTLLKDNIKRHHSLIYRLRSKQSECSLSMRTYFRVRLGPPKRDHRRQEERVSIIPFLREYALRSCQYSPSLRWVQDLILRTISPCPQEMKTKGSAWLSSFQLGSNHITLASSYRPSNYLLLGCPIKMNFSCNGYKCCYTEAQVPIKQIYSLFKTWSKHICLFFGLFVASSHVDITIEGGFPRMNTPFKTITFYSQICQQDTQFFLELTLTFIYLTEILFFCIYNILLDKDIVLKGPQ